MNSGAMSGGLVTLRAIQIAAMDSLVSVLTPLPGGSGLGERCFGPARRPEQLHEKAR